MTRPALTVVLVFSVLAMAEGAVVNIPDPALEAVIRDTLSKPSGDITDAGMATITHLYNGHSSSTPDGERIANLTGLEAATNLVFADLDYGKFTDMSPLASLPNLDRLYIRYGLLESLSSLSGQPSLTEIRAYDNEISALDGIGSLPNLEELDLGRNPFSSLAPLSGMTNLRELFLYDNENITDFSPISTLTGLDTLDVDYMDITDLSFITGMTNLIDVSANGNELTDLSPLATLPNLQSIDLYNNEITTLEDLAPLTNLSWLSVEYNDISDLSTLGGKPNLYYLGIEGNPITDLSFLATLPSLTDLGMGNLPISSLLILDSISTLESVYLAEYDPSILETLVGPSSLKSIGIYNLDHLSDFSFLSHFPGLERFYANWCDIRDLSTLPPLPNLDYLSFYGNELTDPNQVHLADFPSLATLDLGSNFLDTSPGSDDLAALMAMEASVNNLYYSSQRSGVVARMDGAIAPNTGGPFEFTVDGNIEWSIEALPSWASLVSPGMMGPHNGKKTVTVNVFPNYSEFTRSGAIIVNGESTYLRQKGRFNHHLAPFADLSEASLSLEDGGVWYRSEHMGWFFRDARYPWIFFFGYGWNYAFLGPVPTNWMYNQDVSGYLWCGDYEASSGHAYFYFVPDENTLPEGLIGTDESLWPWAFHYGSVNDWVRLTDHLP